MNDIGFKVAFTVENYLTREIKNDPRYVKYLVRIFGVEDGQEFEKMIPFHKCTE